IAGIDRDRCLVETTSGATVHYDALVLATGSYPFVPPVPGHDLPGCFVYRTLDDLERIRAYAVGKRVGAVVGGGLLGLEAANALARQCGLDVGERGGIVVDAGCRTSDPRIYAVGECALAAGRIWGLVAPGYEMARIAVDQILGQGGAFEGGDLSTKLKLMDV